MYGAAKGTLSHAELAAGVLFGPPRLELRKTWITLRDAPGPPSRQHPRSKVRPLSTRRGRISCVTGSGRLPRLILGSRHQAVEPVDVITQQTGRLFAVAGGYGREDAPMLGL